MQDAVGVRVVERAGQLLERVHRLAKVHRGANPVGQGAALDELEDEVGQASLIPEVENFQDVGVLQAGHRARLLLEPFAVLRVLGEEVGEDFDRDVSVEARVISPVHGCHAAAADALHHAVGAERHPFAHVHPTTPSRTRSATAGGRTMKPSVTAGTARLMTGRRPAGTSASALSAISTHEPTNPYSLAGQRRK